MRRPFVFVSAGLLVAAVLAPAIIGGCPSSGGGDSSRYNLSPRVVLAVNPDPARGIAPLTVQFSSDDSTDDGVIVGRFWNFGNGQTSTNATQQVTYTDNGVYVVQLTLTDDDGASATATTTVIVAEKPVAQFTVAFIPSADADPIPNQTTATLSPATFEFDATSSYDPDGDPNQLRFSFDFGDGATVADSKIRHTYSQAGAFRVVLTVTDGTGISDTVETYITVGIREPVIQFRSPPAEISELVLSARSPLWAYVAFDVEPDVPYTIRAGLDIDRDPTPSDADILLDSDATDGKLVLDLPLTVPTALDLRGLGANRVGSYNLFAELRTDRTSPVRAYANAKITLIGDLPAATTTAPLVPFTVDTDGSERARVLMPRPDPNQARFAFNIGRMDRGDRISLALLTTPGYTESFNLQNTRFAVVNETDLLFGVWDADPNNPILYNRTSAYPIGTFGTRYYVIVDAPVVDAPPNLITASLEPAPSMSIRVVRGALPANYVPPTQRIYLNFQGKASVVVAPRAEAFTVAPFDLPDPRNDNTVRQAVATAVLAALAPYRVEVVSSFVPATPTTPAPPPPSPYAEILFDTTTAMSPDVYDDVDQLLLYGRPEVADPRNSVLSGVAVVSVSRIAEDFPALTDAELGVAIANSALQQIGLLCGLHRTQSPPSDIMTNVDANVASPLSFSAAGIIAVPGGVNPIGIQDAPRILGEVFGRN